MVIKRLKLENIDNFEELNIEELSSIEGGLTLAEESNKRIALYPKPCPKPNKPKPKPYPVQPLPCSPYPSKDGKLPWCAVIL